MTHPAGPARAGWGPVSPCGPGCLPAPARAGASRAVRRAVALAAVLLAAAATVPALAVLSPRHRASWVRCWARAVLAAAGVRVVVRQPPSPAGGPALVVANHLSWIEVLALPLVRPVRLLAKAEVRAWPLLGAVAARTGALFVDRARLRALPGTVAGLAAALAAGDSVAVFPEGTTWCGAAAGPFRRAAFQAAIDAGVPVHPVAVVLRDARGAPAAAAAFVGDDDLATALGRVLRAPRTVCELTVLPALPPAGDRAWLAAAATAAIGTVTGVPHGAPAPAAPAPARSSAA